MPVQTKDTLDDNARIEQSTMDIHALHLKLKEPPQCWPCGAPTKQQVESPGNWNGNGDRPMYRCDKCNKFVCFADARGVHPENPRCECPEQPLSRAQLTGETENREIPRAVHYRCAMGMCSFFKYKKDDQGEVVTLHEGRLDAEELRKMGL